jgi:AraC-like DNA-binding protein
MAMSSQQEEMLKRRRARQPTLPTFDPSVSDAAGSAPSNFAARVDAAVPAHPLTFAEEIRRNIRGNMDNPKLSADAVAKLHGIDRRTLSRRLGVEGTSFSELLSSLRYESARALLRDTAVPLSAITAALGYSEQSAFHRAFQMWSGTSPKRFRSMVAVNEALGVPGRNAGPGRRPTRGSQGRRPPKLY